MAEKKKMVFCFYCGRQLIDYNIRETNRCPYCGVELNYLYHKKISEEIKNSN